MSRQKGKRSTGGEAKKKSPSTEEAKDRYETRGDASDRNNIGSSGQGNHRGRERDQKQSAASGRPGIGSAGHRGTERKKTVSLNRAPKKRSSRAVYL